MGNGSPDVAIRLGVTGDAEVKSGFAAIGDAGDATGKRLQAGFDRAAAAADAAAERAIAAGKRVAAAAAIGNPDVAIGATANLPATKEFLAYQAQQQRQAEALRNAIEPLRVAQAAYDRELEVANSLLKSGNINEIEHVKAVALAATSYDHAKLALNGVDSAHKGVSTSGAIMQHVVRSTTDSFAAGLPMSMIFGEQLSRVAEAARYAGGEEGEGKGALKVLGSFLGGPWGLAVMAGVSVLSVFIPKLFETSDAAREAEKQLKAFEDRQADMGRFIDANTGRLKEQYLQLALIAKMQLPAQISAQAGTTQGYVNQAFATARGAVGGQTDLSAIGLGKNRDDLQSAIDRSGGNVQALNRNLQALAGRNPELQALADHVAGLAGQAAEAAMQIATLQGHQRDLNTALQGGVVASTGLIDRQVALATATTGVERAQQQLNAVKERAAAIDAMDSGTAKSKALDQYKADLTSATNAVKAAEIAQKSLRKEQSEAAAEAKRAAAEMAKFLTDMAKLNLAPEIKHMAAADSKAFASEWADMIKDLDGQQKGRLQPLTYGVQQDAAQRSALEYSKLELSTIGLTADKRQLMLDTFLKTQELQREGIDAESDLGQRILAGVAAQDAMNESLAKGATAMAEIRDFGGQLVDDLASGRSITKDLVSEFIKLAAINPLKNLINGNSALPTLTSAIGSIGSLFGNGAPKLAYDLPTIGHNASGTESWRGGLTWVNENGGEIADLPNGTRVYPAAKSREMMSAANDRAPAVHHWHLEGAVVTQDLLDQMNAIGASAATQGAYGGAALAQAQAGKRVRRRMR